MKRVNTYRNKLISRTDECDNEISEYVIYFGYEALLCNSVLYCFERAHCMIHVIAHYINRLSEITSSKGMFCSEK